MNSDYPGFYLDSPCLSSTKDSQESLDDRTLLSLTSDDTKTNQLSVDEKLPRRSSVSTLHQPLQTTPIFFVDGFLSFDILNTWSDVIAHFRQRSVLNNSPCPPLHRLQTGGVSSAHDMAVSIFYQIKGGREDFGEVHSNKHQHDRYGLTHPGIYPEWSGELPIHVLAHSFGGNVVLELQKLLDEQFFHNELGEIYPTNGGWILSAALISSPLRGTTAAYYVGKNPGEIGIVRYLSPGRLLYNTAQIWEWLEQHDPREGWLGIHFRLTHFGLGKDRSFKKLLNNVLGSQLFDKGLDNSSKDLVIEKYLVEPYKAHENTFYRTYTTTMTNTTSNGTEKSILHWCPGISYLSNLMGQFDIVKEGKGYLDSILSNESLWRKNDGVVPLISQFHPQDCCKEPCCHFNLPDPTKSSASYFPSKLNPGTWYTSNIPDCSHIDLVPGFNNSFDIPPVTERVSNWWSRLQNIISPTGFDGKSSSESCPYSSTISEYRRMFMNDYIRFLARVDQHHASTSSFKHSYLNCK